MFDAGPVELCVFCSTGLTSALNYGGTAKAGANLSVSPRESYTPYIRFLLEVVTWLVDVIWSESARPKEVRLP